MTIGHLVLESFNWLIFVCKMEDEDEWTPYMRSAQSKLSYHVI